MCARVAPRIMGAVTLPPTPPAPFAAGPRPRTRAVRLRRGRLLGGVCSGVAQHVGWQVTWVRIAFVVLALFGGFGIALYAAYWAWLPLAADDGSVADKAENGRDLAGVLGLAALALGVVLFLAARGADLTTSWIVPLLLGGAGVAVLWRQSDDSQPVRAHRGRQRQRPRHHAYGAAQLLPAHRSRRGARGVGCARRRRIAGRPLGVAARPGRRDPGPRRDRARADAVRPRLVARPRGRAARPDPQRGAGRGRRAGARLGAADPHPHPACGPRPRRGRASRADRGAGAAALALHPDRRPDVDPRRRARVGGGDGRGDVRVRGRGGARGRRAARRPGRRARRRDPGGRRERREACRRTGVGVRRVQPRRGRGVRARPRPGVRPRLRAGRPARAAGVCAGPHGASRRDGDDPVVAGRGRRGRARAAHVARCQAAALAAAGRRRGRRTRRLASPAVVAAPGSSAFPPPVAAGDPEGPVPAVPEHDPRRSTP